MDALALDAVLAQQLSLVLRLVCRGLVGFLDGRQRGRDVRHHEEGRVRAVCQAFHAAVRELNLVVFFLNRKV